jgi:hypothetical protein
LHQRTIRIEVITGQTNSPYGTNTRKKNTNFPTQPTLEGGVIFFTFAVITEEQMGVMSKVGWLIGWSSRDLGEFLVFSVCGVWFNLQDLGFIPTHFVAFFI